MTASDQRIHRRISLSGIELFGAFRSLPVIGNGGLTDGADGALTGCSVGKVSGSRGPGPLCGKGMRSPLRRRLTVGYSISRWDGHQRLIARPCFHVERAGSKLTGWAPIGSGIAVPIGREKLNVAA